MARKTANGSLRGILGPTVHFERNGEEQMRVRTPHRTDTSQKVFDSRSDFSVLMKLIQDFKALIDKGFKDHKANRSAYHSALSVNRLNYNFAKKETGLENLDWFQFSEGNLSGAAEASARKTADGKIEIIWQGTEKGLTSHQDDQVISCLRISGVGKPKIGPDDVTRDAGSLIIDPGKSSLNKKIEVFIAFAVSSKNYRPGSDRNVSKSKWIGVL